MWLRAYTGCDTDDTIKSGIPKNLLAKACWSVNRNCGESGIEQVEENAKRVMTAGWYSRLIDFHDSAITNYRIMSLWPARLCDDILCDYSPDLDSFDAWIHEKQMYSIAEAWRVQFPRDGIEARTFRRSNAWINPYTAYINPPSNAKIYLI